MEYDTLNHYPVSNTQYPPHQLARYEKHAYVKNIKKTFLHSWHMFHHANMESVGGYDMLLWYASAKNEHLVVLISA